MPRIDDEDKRNRLERIYLLLTRNARGVTEAEIADEINLERRTVNNYLRELEFQGKALKDGLYWYPLVLKESRLRSFDLSPEEAVTLYLGARLLSKQQDKRNEPAETALLRLASVLKADAGVGNEIEQAARELAQRPVQENYQPIFRDVVRGYIYRKKIEIAYRPLTWNKPFQTIFSTYLLEPSPIGFTTYLIGHSSIVNEWRSYKLERIESVRLTKEDYSIPPDFPGLDILRNAWSIVMGEETIRIVLRFRSDTAKARVLETRWHPSQQTYPDPDDPNALLLEFKVADTLDLIPWIRSWGADVEVLEPEELREELMREAKQLARVYKISQEKDENQDRLLRLWGKTKKGNLDPEDFHPVLFHMLDVGNVARELLDEDTSPRWRNSLAKAFNADVKTLSNWLPYFVALHDIGKVSAAFQALNKQQLMRLKHEGFTLEQIDIPHSHISQIYIEDALAQVFTTDSTKVQIFSEALGGHHGRFAHPDNDIKSGRRKLNTEPMEWSFLRQVADTFLKNEFLKVDLNLLLEPPNTSTAVMAFTGFAILCDWLGSDERYFKTFPNMDLSSYLKKSRQRAVQATQGSGLKAPSLSGVPARTEVLFADLVPLRALQLAIDDIPEELLRSPALTIIEAPTGEGKTEAALALAHRIAQLSGTEEMYYALPSMATSNQMFDRLQTHLEKRLGLKADVKLVHGQAYLIEENSQIETPTTSIEPLENGETNKDSEARETISWFNSKKRALIAPFGVGTVDQAELATLNVKHAALRMMGLVGKVVIVDEVHAYDTYMSTIIERLLGWLAAMNTSVILLSATLPKARRQKLAQAYGVNLSLSEVQENAYPSLMVLTSGRDPYQASPDVWQPNRAIELQAIHLGDNNAQDKAKWLLESIADGGCACWITNTVKRAQRIFDALRNIVSPDVDLELLHSQIPLDDRQQREDRLKSKYGRDGKRPNKGIVVGTQVLEQSLDLDFDVMASDLAPIDFLLQRAGRLHRHDRSHPAQHEKPRFWLNYEIEANDNLKIGTDRSIYDEFIMRRTRKTLAEYSQVQLPKDYRTLIEAVYSDKPPSEDDPLYDAWQELQSKQKIASKEARERLLPEPHPHDSFAKAAAMQIAFEEDENRADWVVAKTRLGERTLNIVPLERDGDFAVLDSGGERIKLRADAPRETQRKLLRRQLRISNQLAIDEILNDADKNPTGLFTQSALLKGFYPLWLKGGKKEFKTQKGLLQIVLDLNLGLVIEKEKKANDTDE